MAATAQRSSSVPSLPGIRSGSKTVERRASNQMNIMVQKPADNVPEALQQLDYWQAMKRFEVFDKGKRYLDKDQFFRLVTSSGPGERFTKARLESLFHAVDLDGSGTIDCFEYLGWIFGTDSNYAGAARRRLENIDEQRVVEYYRTLPKHKTEIDKEEFYTFIKRVSPVAMPRDACDELFEYIDTDGSGGVDMREFLDWLHAPRDKAMMNNVRKLEEQAKREAHGDLPDINSRQGSKMGRQTSTGSTYSSKEDMFMDRPGTKNNMHNGLSSLKNANLCADQNSDLFESRPGKPVVLEFTVGPGSSGLVETVGKQLTKEFGTAVAMKIVETGSFKGCQTLKVLVGRGIVLWDRAAMMGYMDDPFRTHEGAKQWITSILRECMPNLLGTVNLRRYYAKKMGW